MASKYYTDAGKEVYNGDVAEDSDVNDINTAVDTAFELVEVDIVTASDSVQYYAARAEEWAESALEIDIGSYSSKYHAEAASVSADEAAVSAAEAAADAAIFPAHVAGVGSEVHGLGTASTEDVQTDDYETGNVLMQAGAFGLGTKFTRSYGTAGDENILDTHLPTQFFTVGYNDCEMVGGPVATPECTGYGAGLCISSTTAKVQVYWEIGDAANGYRQRVFYRTASTLGSWNSWVAIDYSAI